jgi:hypothetical protein
MTIIALKGESSKEQVGTWEDNAFSNLVGIYQAKMVGDFPARRRTLALYYVNKVSIAGDCHSAVRSDMMFPDFYSCLIHQAKSLSSLCESKQGGL